MPLNFLLVCCLLLPLGGNGQNNGAITGNLAASEEPTAPPVSVSVNITTNETDTEDAGEGEIDPEGDDDLVFNFTEAPSLNATEAPSLNATANSTESPTEAVTEAPTIMPTANPTDPITESPTSEPSTERTSAPTAPPKVIITGSVIIVLVDTPSLLIGDSEEVFLSEFGTFVTNQWPDDVQLTRVEVLSQSRQPIGESSDRRRKLFWSGAASTTTHFEINQERLLQSASGAPLYLDVGVLAEVPEGSDLEEFDMSLELETAIESSGDELAEALLNTGDIFFLLLEEVTLEEEETEPPIPTYGPSPPEEEDDDDEVVEEDPKKSLSTGAMVGIALGGMVGLIIIVLVLKNSCLKKNESGAQPNTKSSGSPESKETSQKMDTSQSDNGSVNPKTALLQGSKNQGVPDSNSDLESQGVYSYRDNGSTSGNVTSNASLAGMSTMSYAFSLDAGIAPSVAGDESTHESTHESAPSTHEGRTIGVTDNAEFTMGMNKKPKDPPATTASSTSLAASAAEMSASDLHLTPSELQMLPSNLATSTSEEAAGAPALRKEVVAPPGKLGIVIDTTVEGPVVHQVNEKSALKGKIFPNDIIVAIDNVDTRAMSATAITALMAKTAHKQRRLTVMSSGGP